MLFIELKGGKGRKSKEQKEQALVFHHLKNTIHEIRSFKRFLQIMADNSH